MKKSVFLLVFLFVSIANAQWKEINNGISGDYLNKVYIDDNLFLASSYYLYKSNDIGSSWENISLSKNINPIDYILRKDDTLFIAGSNLYYSIDNLDTFPKVFANIQCNVFEIDKDGNLLVGTKSGLYRITDNGKNLHFFEEQIPYLNIIDIEVSGDTIVLGSYESGIAYSINNGNSWKFMENVFDFMIKKIQKVNLSIFSMGEYGIYFSTNFGADWMMQNNSYKIKGIRDFIVIDSTIFVASEIGVLYKGIFEDKWKHIEKLRNYRVNQLQVYNGKLYAAVWGPGVAEINLSDLNEVRFMANGMNKFNSSRIFSDSDKLYGAVEGVGLYVSNDKGENWSKTNCPINDVSEIKKLNNSIYVSSFNNGLFKSDNGVDFVSLNSDLPEIKINDIEIFDNKIYAAINPMGLYYSEDGGTDWILENSIETNYLNAIKSVGNSLYALNYDQSYVKSISDDSWKVFSQFQNITDIVENNSGLIAITKTYKILFMDKNSSNWKNLYEKFSYVLNNIDILNKNVFVSTSGSLLYSSDYGMTYSDKLTPKPLAKINYVKIIGDEVYLATGGRGFMKAKLSDLGINSVEVNENFDNISIYPSPANDFIRVNIKDMSDFIIFNNLGENVLSGKIGNGDQIDVRELAKGIYNLILINSDMQSKNVRFVKD